MNRSAEQTNRVNREADLVRFVCSALRFISLEPRKKDRSSRDLFVELFYWISCPIEELFLLN